MAYRSGEPLRHPKAAPSKSRVFAENCEDRTPYLNAYAALKGRFSQDVHTLDMHIFVSSSAACLRTARVS